MNSKNRKNLIKFLLTMLMCTLILGACTTVAEGENPLDFVKNLFNQETPVPEELDDITTTPLPNLALEVTAAVDAVEEAAAEEPAEALTPTLEPTPETHYIQLWVPPQFDPEQDVPGGQALARAIASYTESHPNTTISVRVKATSGESSIINTMTAANHVAQDTLPSLALLSRWDMETAVQRGLIQPMNTSIFSDSDTWYAFARQSAIIDNTVYGIPVVGDSLVLTYRTARIGQELTDWPDILTRGLPIAFAPATSTSLFGTFIYLSLGGKLTNDQGQPALDQQKMIDTLNFFLTGGQNGAFPPTLGQLVDQNQAWQRFADGTMSLIISQYSTFRHYQDAQISAMALPTPEDYTDYPLVVTWNLVLVKDYPAGMADAVEFAEYLADISMNDDFTAQAGYLPVRNSAHENRIEDPLFGEVSKIIDHAILVPNNQIMNKIVPTINNAVSQVVRNQMTPEEAAIEAVESLN